MHSRSIHLISSQHLSLSQACPRSQEKCIEQKQPHFLEEEIR